MRKSLAALAALCLCFICAASSPARARELAAVKSILSGADTAFDQHLSNEAILDRLIEVKPGRPRDPQLPLGFEDRVKKSLAVFPRSVLCYLLRERCRIVATPLLTIADATLLDKHPRGYGSDQTYANCRAVFVPRSGSIIVASHYYWGTRLRLNKDAAAFARHELCHAVDFYLGRPSLSPAFRTAYAADRAQMSLVDCSLLDYYLQAGDAGPIETFGQLLADRYSHFPDHRSRALARCFVRCRGLIDRAFPAHTVKPVVLLPRKMGKIY
ncbi:MAG: hypothetical protein JSS83_12505 [Cyanobacteria bacterium SZAS LIN-3]|nr:hypothetical protein [Cyanobacteria bacterium SZAS LIN-3]MBS2009159.1 hypothetical protein [Cyanobacteria bacterium SZAS TMP-1]